MTGTGTFAAFSDGKEPDALRTIGEVAHALGIRQHVLRYWEEHFPALSPIKRSGGRRYYRPQDVQMIATIDRLVHKEGYTLRGARIALEGQKTPTAPAANAHQTVAESAVAGGATLARLAVIRAELARALQET